VSAKRAGSPPPEPPEPGDSAAEHVANETASDAAADERARKSFVLRLPADLHAELRAWAAADLRSLNGQIEWVLREALRRRRGPH
jgi:hypothetical protein